MTLNELFQIPPYGLAAEDKEAALAEILSKLTRHHYEHCPEYHKIIDVLGFDVSVRHSCEQQPFLPVRLLKKYELHSVSKEKVTKTLTSSGTSGQAVSKIFLDADNVRSQSKTLNEIISSFIGKQRLPLLLLDTEMIKKDRSMYSARGAGIIGFFFLDVTLPTLLTPIWISTSRKSRNFVRNMPLIPFSCLAIPI